MLWIMCFAAAVCLIFAACAKDEARYWKGRCERVEAGYADRDVIQIVNSHRRPGRVPGPALRLIVDEQDESAVA